MKIFWPVGAVIILIGLITAGAFVYFRNSAEFYSRNKVNYIFPTEGNGQTLPDKLLISPGKYNFNGRIYHLKHEGLYRFRDGDKLKNRIVYQNDPWAIISGLAWAEGPWAPKDKKLKPSTAVERILGNNINLSCGNISSVATIILGGANIESRSVMGLNLQYDWNDNEDNGHTMLEAKIDGRWAAVDIDNNITFSADGHRLSLWEFFQKVSGDLPYNIEYLSRDSNGRTEKELRVYYKKMYQVPFIFSGKYFMFTAEGEAKDKAQQYSHRYRFLDRQAWFDKFYPGYGYE